MTEVLGPLGPPLRASSLPIRGAEAAHSAAADRSMLRIGVGMAQMFEIPSGIGAGSGNGLRRSPQTVLGRQPETPLPADRSPDPQPEYGTAPSLLQARNSCPAAAPYPVIPAPNVGSTLIDAAAIDKIRALPVQAVLTMPAGRAARRAAYAAIYRFST